MQTFRVYFQEPAWTFADEWIPGDRREPACMILRTRMQRTEKNDGTFWTGRSSNIPEIKHWTVFTKPYLIWSWSLRDRQVFYDHLNCPPSLTYLPTMITGYRHPLVRLPLIFHCHCQHNSTYRNRTVCTYQPHVRCYWDPVWDIERRAGWHTNMPLYSSILQIST